MTKRISRSYKRLQHEQHLPPAQVKARAESLTKRRGRIAAGVLLAFALLVLVPLLTGSRFAVAQIDVQGATLVDPAQVQDELSAINQSVFLVNTRALETELLETFGCFRRVRVQTRLPNRLVVQVTEKDAVLLWESQGRYWWVDAQGQVLGAAPHRGELPAVHDRQGLVSEPGDYIVGVPWDYVTELSRSLPSVSDYDFTLEDGLILTVTTERWPVYLGYDGDAERKVTLLKELAAELTTQQDRVIYIDLKNERRPAVKVESG